MGGTVGRSHRYFPVLFRPLFDRDPNPDHGAGVLCCGKEYLLQDRSSYAIDRRQVRRRIRGAATAPDQGSEAIEHAHRIEGASAPHALRGQAYRIESPQGVVRLDDANAIYAMFRVFLEQFDFDALPAQRDRRSQTSHTASGNENGFHGSHSVHSFDRPAMPIVKFVKIDSAA
jgi:hypothetical protein